MKNEKNKKKLNLMSMLILIGMLPLICITIITNLIVANSLNNELKQDVETKLAVSCEGLNQYYGTRWSSLNSEDYSYVDSLLYQEVELTLFEGDTRLISSIKDEKGERIVGTKASDTIINEVLYGGKTYFAEDVIINNEEYFAYYSPIRVNGEIVGMAFAGETKANVESAIQGIVIKIIMISMLIMAVFALIIVYVAMIFKKPLKKITDELQVIASGNLQSEINISSLIYETDQMIESTKTIQNNLKEIVNNTKNTATDLSNGVKEINDLSIGLSDGAGQINRAVEELSIAAGSMAENVQSVNSDIIDMGENINSISGNVVNLNNSSEVISNVSDQAKQYIAEVLESSNKSVEAVEGISQQIDSTNESINKINEAIEFIQDITSETKLLSLNASIEAARAGESGRGFSVVAENIRELSEQSNKGAVQIKMIAEEIFNQSKRSVELANDIKQIISEEQKKISETNSSFIQLKSEIERSHEQIESINAKTGVLSGSKNSIIGSVEDLSTISQQNAASNQEVAANVESMSNDISTVKDKANNINELATKLEEVISIFKI